MYPASIIQFEVSVETTFSQPVAFTRLNVEALAEALLSQFALQGLTPGGILVRRNDALYDYLIRFDLFRGNASFTINATSVKAEFRYGRLRSDLTSMTDVLARFHACLKLPEKFSHDVRNSTHFTFQQPEGFDAYFSPKGTRYEALGRHTGFTVWVNTGIWPQTVRVALEPSMVYEQAGFMMASTLLDAIPITTGITSQVIDAFSQAAYRCQIELIAAL